MNFLVNFNALDTETLDTKNLDISSAEPVWKHLGTSFSGIGKQIFCQVECITWSTVKRSGRCDWEDEKLLKDDICLGNMLPHRKSYLSFHDLDYAEKIKELQCFLDSVKKIASPGCSQEVLNVALSLMSTLVGILSAMSLEQYPRASL